MLLYDAICKICNKKHEYYVSSYEDRENTPFCCNQRTQRAFITSQLGVVDHPWFMTQHRHLYAGKG